jgi:hypothetical protein
MKLFYPGYMEITKKMELYSPGCMEKNRQKKLYSPQGVKTITDK